MRILISSYVFAPSVGGIETVSSLLAPEFVKAGHEVIVVTKTRQDDELFRDFTVFREPSPAKLIELTRWCDVFFQSNISLRLAWPLLFIRRPWVIAQQTWLNRPDPWFYWHSFLKLFLLHFSTNIAISRALAESLPVSLSATLIRRRFSSSGRTFRASGRSLIWAGWFRKRALISFFAP